MNPEIAARLRNLGISLISEGVQFCVFAREGCLGMVPRSPEPGGFLAPGSTGILLDQGLGYLVWREQRPFLVGNGFALPAQEEQVNRIRQFTMDLQFALGVPAPSAPVASD